MLIFCLYSPKPISSVVLRKHPTEIKELALHMYHYIFLISVLRFFKSCLQYELDQSFFLMFLVFCLIRLSRLIFLSSKSFSAESTKSPKWNISTSSCAKVYKRFYFYIQQQFCFQHQYRLFHGHWNNFSILLLEKHALIDPLILFLRFW